MNYTNVIDNITEIKSKINTVTLLGGLTQIQDIYLRECIHELTDLSYYVKEKINDD